MFCVLAVDERSLPLHWQQVDCFDDSPMTDCKFGHGPSLKQIHCSCAGALLNVVEQLPHGNLSFKRQNAGKGMRFKAMGN